MAGVALVTAVVTILVRRHHPELAANVAENARRRAERARANAATRQENAQFTRAGMTIEYTDADSGGVADLAVTLTAGREAAERYFGASGVAGELALLAPRVWRTEACE